MDRQDVRIPRKVIRAIYSATQWSLKRKNYPYLTPDDVRRTTGTKLARAKPLGEICMSLPTWIAIDGEQVMTPDTIPWYERDPRPFPSKTQIEFLETILAWSMRTDSVTEEQFQHILTIMRGDVTLTPLVPFLVSTLRSTAVRVHIPDQRVRMVRLADAWTQNVRLRRELHTHIPMMIASIRRILTRGEIEDESQVVKMEEFIQYLSRMFTEGKPVEVR